MCNSFFQRDPIPAEAYGLALGGLHLFSMLVDFLFPPRCPCCSSYVERRGDFCDVCARRLVGLRAVARPVDAAAVLAGIWTFGHYRAGVRDLLRALKYQKKKSVLPHLHAMLAAGDDVWAALPRVCTAVAVPLAPARAHARGFNQSELIFAPWLAAHGVSLAPLLVRTRETAPLYEFSRTERRRELHGAFAVAEGAQVAGRDILLVDDIMTTGTTLAACARTLKRAGAENVYALVLASEHN